MDVTAAIADLGMTTDLEADDVVTDALVILRVEEHRRERRVPVMVQGPVTVPGIDEILAKMSFGLHAPSEVDRTIARRRLDFWLEKRFELNQVHRTDEAQAAA